MKKNRKVATAVAVFIFALWGEGAFAKTPARFTITLDPESFLRAALSVRPALQDVVELPS